MSSIKELNQEYNEKLNELFEKILCDKCMKEIKIGEVEGKLILNEENKMMLCKKCTEELKKELIGEEGFFR